MPIAFLIDESMRHGSLRNAIHRHNLQSPYAIESLTTGDEGAPPLGTLDPHLLSWCESSGRILVCNDRTTMAGHFADHLNSGHHSPGLFILRPAAEIPQIVTFLATVSAATNPEEWIDLIEYFP